MKIEVIKKSPGNCEAARVRSSSNGGKADGAASAAQSRGASQHHRAAPGTTGDTATQFCFVSELAPDFRGALHFYGHFRPVALSLYGLKPSHRHFTPTIRAWRHALSLLH